MITLPSPNTSLSFGCGSTLLSPLIQPSNGLKLTPGAGFGAVIAFQSPTPISSVAFGNDATWPVWSA